jgi:hypothetical protein
MSVFIQNNNEYNNIFNEYEKFNCDSIDCLESRKNKDVFFDRSVDCAFFGNENNKNYYMNHSPNYLWSDYRADNCINIVQKKPSISKDKIGFECNDETFLIKPKNCHNYRNGIHYNEKNNLYCTNHQIFNNVKEKDEVSQHCENNNNYQSFYSSTIGRCKAIHHPEEWKK